MARFIFWVSACVVLFTYLGYPALLAVWSRLCCKPVRKAEWFPMVTVILPVHNGAQYIEKKLSNLLALDYPPNRLEVLVVSDGSTDGTVELARRLATPQLRILELPTRVGKPTALNVAMFQAQGEIVVFNDVRQTIAPDALRKLVANLNDSSIGAVSGEFYLVNEQLSPQLGLYYRYEQWIRRRESEIHSMVGAAGALSAIRRSLYRPLPTGVILDDVFTPMQIVLRGYRAVFEPDAKAYDPHDQRPEFRRKLRTLTGNWQLLSLMPEILSPRNPLLVQYVCHKLARLAVPFFLLLLLGSSIWLHQGFYAFALFAQFAFYAMAVFFRKLSRLPGLATVSASSFSFVMANCAALLGLFAFLRGKKDVWV